MRLYIDYFLTLFVCKYNRFTRESLVFSGLHTRAVICHDKSMKIHIVTVGEPKLAYAKDGFELYRSRLTHYHHVRVTHIADKKAYDTDTLLKAAQGSYLAVLDISGRQMSSEQLAHFLEIHAVRSRDVCFMIGGPEGLPSGVRAQADELISLSSLTFPHDLAMLVLSEALYRASTISAGSKYHK